MSAANSLPRHRRQSVGFGPSDAGVGFLAERRGRGSGRKGRAVES